MRTAGLVGGIATGALLLAGTAAQAADTDVQESTGDLVMATPEALGGLPIPTDAVLGATQSVPGLNALPTNQLPVVSSVVPDQAPVPAADNKVKTDTKVKADAKTDTKVDTKDQPAPAAGSPVGDLLGNLGGGLPVPLPF